MNLLDRIFPTSRTADRLEERLEDKRAYRAGLEDGRVEARHASTVVWGAPRSNAGEVVTEERSLTISAVYAAVMILANTTASLPLKLYRRRSDGGKEEARDHPLFRVLHSESNPRMSAYKYRQALMVHMLLWGNSYSEIETDGFGDVTALWPINPRRVEILRDGNRTQYKIWLPGGGFVIRDQAQILHISNLGFDGVKGKSPIALFRESLGVGLAAEKYGANFFKNDARAGIYLTHPQKLSDTAHAHLKRDIQEQQGGANNAWKPQILEEGMEIKSIGLPPGDAQFLETKEFGVLEVARIFNVPPHMLAELTRATFSNIEEQSLSFVTKSLRERLVNIEQEANRRLLTEQEKGDLFAEHSIEGLLRGDQESRAEFYKSLWQMGAMSPNDILKKENMNPIEGGDRYYVPMNFIPTDQVGEFRSSVGHTEHRHETRATPPPRYRIAQGLLPMLRDTFDRANRREIAEIEDAVDRFLVSGNIGSFRNFLDDFQSEHAEWLMDRGRIIPLYESFSVQMTQAAQDEVGIDVEPDEGFTRDYADAYAKRHTGATRGQLESLLDESDPEEAVRTRLTEWSGAADNPARFEKEASRELVRAREAFTKTAWARGGVIETVWRTVGQNCPMCNHLNGAVASIQRFFVGEGDSIPNTDGTDLTVRTNVGHPPVHDGCDCFLSPGSGRGKLSDAEYRRVKQTCLDVPMYSRRNGVHA